METISSKIAILIVTLFYAVIAQDQTQTPTEFTSLPANYSETVVTNLTTMPTLFSNATGTTVSEISSVTNDEDTDIITIGYSSTIDPSSFTTLEKSTTPKYIPTTSRPTSPPFPNNVGSWSVNGTLNPCIMLTGALQLQINISNTTKMSIDVPSIAGYVNVSGMCKPSEQELSLNWTSKSISKTLKFKFGTQAKNKYAMLSIQYFNDSSSKPLQIDGPFFQTSLNHSYRCTSNQRIGNKASNFSIVMEKFQFEAFIQQRANSTLLSFDEPEDCSADHLIVKGVLLGMVAGAALSAIVGVVLAVYLCRRYRQGYQPLNDDTVIVS